MTDLFEAASRAARAAAPAPAKPSITPTGRFTPDPVGGAAHFEHDCGRCGAPHAMLGENVRLRAAINAGNAALAGTWLCVACDSALKAEGVAA